MSKLRITPIGTCRVHTPLRRGSMRYPIELDLRRNYGFIHTSAEALQQLRFLQGEKSFDPANLPLVFREADHDRLAGETWELADLHIVEISSSKRIVRGGDVLQSNYVQRHFADFLASTDRARAYWTLVKRGDRQALRAFLEEQPSYTVMGESDRLLLAELSMEQQSFKAIRTEMAEIVERLGAERVIFQTHVNAADVDGDPIPTRERLIRWVKLAADQLGVRVFDPTPLMSEVGQEWALEDGGRDLTHFSLPFSDMLYDALHGSHIGTGIEAGAHASGSSAQAVGQLAAQLEAMLAQGDFFAASRKIHDALRAHPDAGELIALRGVVRARIGDHEGAIADLGGIRDEALLSQPARVALLQAMSSVGDAAAALRVARKLLNEEFASAEIYRSAAVAAHQCGELDLALRYAKEAFRAARHDLSSALQALDLLLARGQVAEAAVWRSEVLENVALSSTGGLEVASWALRQRDEELFAAVLPALGAAEPSGAVDVAEEALAGQLDAGLAAAIPLVARLERVSPVLSKRRDAFLAESLVRAGALLADEEFGTAHAIGSALGELSEAPLAKRWTEVSREGLRIAREALRRIRLDIRTAYSADEKPAVVRIGKAAGEALLHEPDSAVLVAKGLESAGRTADAIGLLKQAREINPKHFGVVRWLARLGAQSGDMLTALDAYAALQGSGQALEPRLQAEIDRYLQIAERGAPKRIRSLAESGHEDEAIDLASKLQGLLGESDRIARERLRLRRNLRIRLKEQAASGEILERENILQKLVLLDPDDPSALRQLAVELMRQFRFEEATRCWERLHQLQPDDESAERNRVRCATLAARRAQDQGGSSAARLTGR